MTDRISISRINSMGFCPRFHHFQYTLNLEPKSADDSLNVGKLVHATIEAYYKNHRVMPIIPDDLGEVGQKARSATQTYSLLARMQDNFDVVDVEKAFDVTLEDLGVRFVGVIDAVVRVQGQLWLLEHKTCSQHWSAERIQLANQHVLYELVAEELYGEPVAGTMYNFMRITRRGGEWHTDAKRVYVPADSHARAEAYEDLAGKLGAIRSGYKSRNPGSHCSYCAMFRLCQSDYLGGDSQYLIDTYYQQRNKTDDSVEADT